MASVWIGCTRTEDKPDPGLFRLPGINIVRERRALVKKILMAVTLLAGFGASGCVAVLAAGAGATTVACTEEELDCPVD